MREFPPFRLDIENQYLWRGTERIALTPKAFSVLQYLVEHAGRLVTQGELLEALWPGTFVQPEVLKSHILDIRNALGDDARNPAFIETQPKRGYRFIAVVRNGETVKPAPEPPPAKPSPDASIAVLPFANLSGEKDNEYFSDGLSEGIINELAKIRGLKVIARTSAFAFKGQNQDIRRIAEALGVANVLEGSVRKAGNRVRITAQLIAASDGSHLWSESYDRETNDILAIQDEISVAIAEVLQSKLAAAPPRRAVSKESTNPEAYQAYLEGRYYMHQVTPKGMERSLECYQRAIGLDPVSAFPHVGMAERVYYQAIYMAGRPRDIVPAALASLARALHLDPGAAEAHFVRAIFSSFYEYNWDSAGEHYGRAVELDPASGRIRASRCVWFLVPTGGLEEALVEIKRAVHLDPLNPAVRTSETWVLHVARKSEAVERARTMLQLFPSHWIASFIASHAFMCRGLYDEAVAALEKGLQIVPGSAYLLGALALAHACQGRASEVEQIRTNLDELATRQHVPFLPRAHASEACGDTDQAYLLLDHAVDEREPLAVPLLTDRLHDRQPDPRFQSLLRKMNLA